MSFPAVLPEVSEAWQLSAAEAGWIGGIYFAGYALAVPFLSSASDRLDGRWLVAASSLLGAVAGFAFAGLASDFWTALLLRFAGGIALAGVHMPGLTLLTERIEASSQARSVSIFVELCLGQFRLLPSRRPGRRHARMAGRVLCECRWPAARRRGCRLILRPSPRARSTRSSFIEDFRDVLRDRSFLAYVLGFAGNTWEVFGIRVWFVACLAWTMSIPGNGLDLPNLAVIAGLSSLVGVPASVLVAEVASRSGKAARDCRHVCRLGVGVSCARRNSGRADRGRPLVADPAPDHELCRCRRARCRSCRVADPARRGTALAVYALAGFTSGFLGPAAIGLALDLCGGAASASGWIAAFLVIAVGSTAAGLAIACARRGIRPHPAG